MKKRILATITALLMFVLVLGGCASKDEAVNAQSKKGSTEEAKEEFDDKAAAEEITEKYEALPTPESVTDPDEFLKVYDEYAELCVESGELSIEHPESKELFIIFSNMTDDHSLWDKQKGAIKSQYNTEEISEIEEYIAFGEACNESASKIVDILNKVVEAFDHEG